MLPFRAPSPPLESDPAVPRRLPPPPVADPIAPPTMFKRRTAEESARAAMDQSPQGVETDRVAALLEKLIVISAQAPSRFAKRLYGDALVDSTFLLIYENKTDKVTAITVWVDFSNNNGKLLLTRTTSDETRVDSLDSASKVVSNRIPVPPRGKIYTRNNDVAAYTFVATDFINVGVFDLSDI